jgi:hypothetical protein
MQQLGCINITSQRLGCSEIGDILGIGGGANHIARPRRLDRLKPLKRSRSVLPFSTRSGPVRDCIFNQVPRNPSISLHLDRLLSSMFFRMYVSRVFGLLIKTAQPPVLTDELACDSSIACIKDLYCAPRNVLDCVLEKLPTCARSTSTFSRSYICPRHRLSRLRQSNRHSSFGRACSTLTSGLVLVLAFSPTELATLSRTHSRLN